MNRGSLQYIHPNRGSFVDQMEMLEISFTINHFLIPQYFPIGSVGESIHEITEFYFGKSCYFNLSIFI